ncbi:MAG: hypothetical protein CMJ58_09330 [Planctomycetaceae bacterium]|nr:hypothetical protein [Planctomycetaceae bacterium]
MNWQTDQRVVLTLDAGGTNFAFSAVQGGRQIAGPVVLPAEPNDLEKSLANMAAGFQQLIDGLDGTPAAISFAFPGPADYPRGIIDNGGNLPAYAGGVPLGAILADRFQIPVYMNNDGDLFAYGEAIAGLLPKINKLLEEAGSPKRYRNLFAVTLGTGFGGGIVRNSELFIGDNSNAGEIWLMRNKLGNDAFAEEGASIRAVQGAYAEAAGIAPPDAPSPKEIFDIGTGAAPGDAAAAKKAFETLGVTVGDALANALTLIDGLAVIGGGLTGAAPLFMPSIINELNGTIAKYNGERIPRLAQRAFNLEDPEQLAAFLKGETKEIAIPGSDRTVAYDPLKRIGVGISELGANAATSIGAYAFALQQLDLAN